MLSKAPTGSGQKEKRPEKKKDTRRSRSPSMDADGIMANLSSSEDGSPKKKTTTLRRLDTQSFDPDSSFAEDEVASEQEEEENPPLTETAKAQFTSSIHGNVR